ncbi:hypothetical protein EON82_01565 [bacterium]|nr:MAG: hypothetical protein EON82_01565 [bacterium]
MRTLLALSAAVLALSGCSSASPEADGNIKPGSGVATNPGGKPRTPEEEAYAKQMQQAGAVVNDDRAKMAEARKQAGQ